jgi:hypothetical protein
MASYVSDVDDNIEKTKEIYSTDDRRITYTNQNLDNYKRISTVMFWLYYAMIIVISYLIYKNPAYQTPIKIAIIVGMATYPFIAYLIEYYIYSLYLYIKAMFTGTVYVQPNLARSRI